MQSKGKDNNANVLETIELKPGEEVELTTTLGAYHIQGKLKSGTGTLLFVIGNGSTPGIFGVDLTTDAWVTVNSATFPFLINRKVAFTNNINSPGNLEIRIVLETGAVYDSGTVAPGEALDFTLHGQITTNPTDYFIEVKAADANGLYYISLDDGTL